MAAAADVVTPCSYTHEADAAAAAEEERRQAALKASKTLLAASLGQQLKEREAVKHAHDDEEQVCFGIGIAVCRLVVLV